MENILQSLSCSFLFYWLLKFLLHASFQIFQFLIWSIIWGEVKEHIDKNTKRFSFKLISMTRRFVIPGISFLKNCFLKCASAQTAFLLLFWRLDHQLRNYAWNSFCFRQYVVSSEIKQVQTHTSQLTVGKWNVLLLFKWCVPRVKPKTKGCNCNYNQKSKCPFINTWSQNVSWSKRTSVRKILPKLFKVQIKAL